MLGSFFQLFITIGIFLGAAFPYLLKKTSGDHTGQSFWHIVFAFPQPIIIIQSIVLALIFPYETPKYLLSMGKKEEARSVISILYN